MLSPANQATNGMPDRHGIEIHHKAAAAQQEQPGQRDDERLNFAEVDDEPLQRAEEEAKREHQSTRHERMPSDHVEIGHRYPDEADHRSNREIDAAGENDKGRADRSGDDEGVVGEDVAENQRREEILVQESSDQEQRQEDSDRRNKRQVLLIHLGFLAKPANKALRKLLDCSSSTMTTTTALTTKLYSGGRPLVRMDVVSVWITSAPRTVMPR